MKTKTRKKTNRNKTIKNNSNNFRYLTNVSASFSAGPYPRKSSMLTGRRPSSMIRSRSTADSLAWAFVSASAGFRVPAIHTIAPMPPASYSMRSLSTSGSIAWSRGVLCVARLPWSPRLPTTSVNGITAPVTSCSAPRTYEPKPNAETAAIVSAKPEETAARLFLRDCHAMR